MPSIRLRNERVVKDPSKLLRVSLMLKFDPDELGPEKTQKLMHGLIDAVSEVLEPAERKEMARQLDEARKRLRATG
jgi:hypothetical protein